MDDVTKHHLYITPSIGKLHVMIQLLMNHYIIRELLFGKILTFKKKNCCNFLLSQKKIVIFWRKCYGKKLHHPWTKNLGFGQFFFLNFHIFLQTFCQLTLNLGANAVSKKWRKDKKKYAQ
jgi:hypothetical protein